MPSIIPFQRECEYVWRLVIAYFMTYALESRRWLTLPNSPIKSLDLARAQGDVEKLERELEDIRTLITLFWCPINSF